MNPTSAPPAAGFTPGPTFNQTLDNVNCNFLAAANTAASASGASQMVGCGGGSHGTSLMTTTCNGTVIDTAGQCAKVTAPADGTTGTFSVWSQGFNMLYNGSTWDRAHEASNTNGAIAAMPDMHTRTTLSATSGTCTNVKSAAGELVALWYVSSSAQTGTLTIYDEASATCTGPIIYVSATHGVTTVPELLYMPYQNGYSYKWTTAAEVGSVYAGTTP